MRVKDGTRLPLFDDANMEWTFVRRLAPVTAGPRLFINRNYLLGQQRALIEPAGRNRQAQRIAFEDGAKVAARAQHPAAAMKFGGDRCQLRSNLNKTLSQSLVILSRAHVEQTVQSAQLAPQTNNIG